MGEGGRRGGRGRDVILSGKFGRLGIQVLRALLRDGVKVGGRC